MTKFIEVTEIITKRKLILNENDIHLIQELEDGKTSITMKGIKEFTKIEIKELFQDIIVVLDVKTIIF